MADIVMIVLAIAATGCGLMAVRGLDGWSRR